MTHRYCKEKKGFHHLWNLNKYFPTIINRLNEAKLAKYRKWRTIDHLHSLPAIRFKSKATRSLVGSATGHFGFKPVMKNYLRNT